LTRAPARVLGLLTTVALLAACPKSSSRPAREAPVEIDWPDAAPLPAPVAEGADRSASDGGE